MEGDGRRKMQERGVQKVKEGGEEMDKEKWKKLITGRGKQ